MDARYAWEVAYSQLELQFDRASFNTWLRGASFVSVENNVFVIGVRNSYVRDMLQTRLYPGIRQILGEIWGQPVEVEFKVRSSILQGEGDTDGMPLFRLLAEQQDDDDTLEPLYQRVSGTTPAGLPECELNPRFTFDRFIVNGSNRITYEAARAVAENPGRSYNPLMVYGGVGLGKTHLLHAIGHVYSAKGLRVVYIPSEAFTNDLVTAIRNKTTAMFRDKYRSVDALLVDDIQFIAGKESTESEFFHTFNALYTINKQIVLAADRPPRELENLTDRLRSRFEGGLVTDVKPLEFESRLALLEMWALERSVALPADALLVLAERPTVNVRELEGMFNQIVAKSHLWPNTLSVGGVEQTLFQYDQPRFHGRANLLTITQVILKVAEHFQLTPQDLTGKRRTGRVNQARQIAMYLVRELTEASLPQIGEAFGKRSHSTVLHGCNKVLEEIAVDTTLREHVNQLRNSFSE